MVIMINILIGMIMIIIILLVGIGDAEAWLQLILARALSVLAKKIIVIIFITLLEKFVSI